MVGRAIAALVLLAVVLTLSPARGRAALVPHGAARLGPSVATALRSSDDVSVVVSLREPEF